MSGDAGTGTGAGDDRQPGGGRGERSGSDSDATGARKAGQSLYEGLLDVLFTGIAITVPLVITVYVLAMALDLVASALAPAVALLQWAGVIERFRSVTLIETLIDLGIYDLVVGFLTELIVALIFLGIVLLVGSVGHNHYGERVIDYVDMAIASIPGVGTVYKSFRRMGDVMLDNEAENFQEVRLVRCLGEDMYLIGFETSESPPTVTEAVGEEEMVTMFLPLAPNPVTGGFLTYVPRDRVVDVDMTIEEGVRSILTSGVASSEPSEGPTAVSIDDLEKIADPQRLQDALNPQPGEPEGESD
jgi:uncharacterized membrane protein